MDNAPKGKRQLGIILLCILVGIGIFMLCFSLYRHTFSRQRWTAEPEYRRYMLASLERRHPLVGMTEEEVTALLGNEDGGQSGFSPGGGAVCPPETGLVYYIGGKSGEDLWFILSFENGVCTGYTVETTQ